MSLGQEMKSLQETLKQQQLSANAMREAAVKEKEIAEQNTVALFTVKCLSYIKHCLTQGILPKPIEIRTNSLRNCFYLLN